ncbi:TPA: glycosyltransferase, partial [Candidatus Bathyarchaeota archaeon]|nr:glycosyltransferase [Candidatus Bathyarchaeota archaeon]
MENTDLPNVSILISTKNRRGELKKAIDSIKDLDYPNYKLEIVVVEETDEPQKIDGVVYIPIPVKNRGYGYTRNVAVKNASNEILVFTDDDCMVAKDWLKEIVSPLIKDKGIVGVTGGVLVKNCTAIGYCENVLGFPNGGLMRIHNSKGNIVETQELSTCNCAYRREIFEKVGLFRTDTKYGGEDYEFAKRICRHYPCVFHPKAIVYHKPRGSLKKIFRWFVRRGINEWFLGKMKIHNIWKHILYNLRNSLVLK